MTSFWRRIAEAAGAGLGPSDEPWYRRPEVWFVVGVVLLPFGWVLGLCRIAWISMVARRRPQVQAIRTASAASVPRSSPPTA